MTEVTAKLSDTERGDCEAAEQVLPPVYDELRTLAARELSREAPGRRSRSRWFTSRIAW